MGSVRIEIDPKRLTADVVNAIKSFGPGKHAGEVKLQSGSTILCGRSTVYNILHTLREHGATVQYIVETGKRGVSKQLPWCWFADNLGTQKTGATGEKAVLQFVPPKPIASRSSNPTEVELRDEALRREREKEYFDMLTMCNSIRGPAIHVAASAVADAVNSLSEKGDLPLYPYHFVTFTEKSSDGECKSICPSLAKLNDISPKTAEIAWGYVKALEGKGDEQLAMNALTDTILTELSNPVTRGKFTALPVISEIAP